MEFDFDHTEIEVGPKIFERDASFLQAMGRCVESGKFELPVLPSIALKLTELAGLPRSSAEDVKNLIATDQSIAVQVLRIANSALYGGRVELKSLKDSVVRLGMRNIRSIVFAISMKMAIFKGKQIDILAGELWRHSITCAYLGEELAKKATIDVDSGEMFTCGLIHDIHKIPLMAAFKEVIKEIADYFPRTEILDYAYRQFFDPVFAKIAETWKLPQTSVEIIQSIHNGQKLSNAAALLSLSNKLVEYVEDKLYSHDCFKLEMEALQIDAQQTEDLLQITGDLYQKIEAHIGN